MTVNANIEGVMKLMREDEELRRLYAIHYIRAEEAKFLMRQAGFGCTGQDILETTKEVLNRLADLGG